MVGYSRFINCDYCRRRYSCGGDLEPFLGDTTVPPSSPGIRLKVMSPRKKRRLNFDEDGDDDEDTCLAPWSPADFQRFSDELDRLMMAL